MAIKEINKIMNKEKSFDWGTQNDWYIKTINKEIFEDRIYEKFFTVDEGDIVLDPMAGSGTTLKMAKLNNRKYVGIDINQEYVNLCERRVESVEPYNETNPNPKDKFIVSREEMLEKRKVTREQNKLQQSKEITN